MCSMKIGDSREDPPPVTEKLPSAPALDASKSRGEPLYLIQALGEF